VGNFALPRGPWDSWNFQTGPPDPSPLFSAPLPPAQCFAPGRRSTTAAAPPPAGMTPTRRPLPCCPSPRAPQIPEPPPAATPSSPLPAPACTHRTAQSLKTRPMIALWSCLLVAALLLNRILHSRARPLTGLQPHLQPTVNSRRCRRSAPIHYSHSTTTAYWCSPASSISSSRIRATSSTAPASMKFRRRLLLAVGSPLQALPHLDNPSARFLSTPWSSTTSQLVP
jgi:hypothetical protein